MKMAESQAIAKQALKKLDDQLTCAICLDAFKDPKLLQCFHVYCKDCLQRLVVQNQQGQLSLRCPTCRQSTTLPPATDLSALQPAFHIHHLFEIQEALKKVSDPKNILCEKCSITRQSATNFCRDCGQFICETCSNTHCEWKEISNHEVVSIQQLQTNVKELLPPNKVTLYCSQHKGKELELYCETCEELICFHCTVNKHCRPQHNYDLVTDSFERHKTDITASLQPVDKLCSTVSNAIKQLDLRSQQLNDQRASTKASIRQEMRRLHKLIEVQEAELIGQVDQHTDVKLENLAAQKKELEIVHTQLDSCLSFVSDSLRTGSEGEVMKIKKGVTKRIKEMTDNFNPDILPPCESANIKFVSSPDLTQACQQFGEVYLSKLSPEQCIVTGKGLKVAELGERAIVCLQVYDQQGKDYTPPVEMVTCELASDLTCEKIDCSVEKKEAGKYQISYQTTTRGRHQLHIKVEGERVKGSPFPVIVKLPIQKLKLGTPIMTINDLNRPSYVAINQRGEIIVTEHGGSCVSIFNPTGEKLQSFGSKGSGHGQFNNPIGVAVDDDGNILVADESNNCIQKFTSDGKFITTIGNKDGKLKFSSPQGIAIHPHNKKLYIVDNKNHCVQILNHDLTFSSSFGSRGSNDGQFFSPWDVAVDSTGNVYVVDTFNHCIQIFTSEGRFLKKFWRLGEGNGKLNYPTCICIDCDNVVYVTEIYKHRVSVFTCDGKFLTSICSNGSEPGQFSYLCGIAVDKNGVLYVCDIVNNRLQLL